MKTMTPEEKGAYFCAAFISVMVFIFLIFLFNANLECKNNVAKGTELTKNNQVEKDPEPPKTKKEKSGDGSTMPYLPYLPHLPGHPVGGGMGMGF